MAALQSRSLETLPDEILLDILKNYINLPTDDAHYRKNVEGRRALLSLSRCSKYLYAITAPFILHTLVQTGNFALQGLVKRLLDEPEAGQHVRRLVCTSDSMNDSDEPIFDMTAFTETDFSKCADIILLTMSGPTALEWMDDLESGSWDALVTLLLCQTPCLEYLKLSGYNERPSGKYLNTVLSEAACPQSDVDLQPSAFSLPKLSSVEMAYSEYYGCDDFDIVHAFVSIKSVERFQMNRLVVWESHGLIDGRYNSGVDQIYHTKYLDLGSSYFQDTQVNKFLTRFKSLEHFKYRQYNVGEYNPGFFPKQWARALNPSASTLQTLDFAGDPGGDPTEDVGTDGEVFGTLVHFQSLRELTTCACILISPLHSNSSLKLVEMLPKSLEKLLLYDCDYGFCIQLLELLGRKRECVPALKSVRITYCGASHIDQARMAECRAAGVEII